MPFLLFLGFMLLLAIMFLPQIWVRHVMHKYGQDRSDFPGTGGELAQHLLDAAQLDHVQVEETKEGDHYDPVSFTIRLSKANFSGRSVTAVAVAAHEVSHAFQHHNHETLFMRRIELVQDVQRIERIASILLMLLPVTLALFRSPLISGFQIIVVMFLLCSRLVVHFFTLPVEWDASFRKALPILTNGYLDNHDHAAARHVLLAAAFTYISAAFATLFNILRILR